MDLVNIILNYSHPYLEKLYFYWLRCGDHKSEPSPTWNKSDTDSVNQVMQSFDEKLFRGDFHSLDRIAFTFAGTSHDDYIDKKIAWLAKESPISDYILAATGPTYTLSGPVPKPKPHDIYFYFILRQKFGRLFVNKPLVVDEELPQESRIIYRENPSSFPCRIF